MIPMMLPKDAVLELDQRLTVKVGPGQDCGPVRVSVSSARGPGGAGLLVAVGALAFIGGLATRDLAGYAQTEAAERLTTLTEPQVPSRSGPPVSEPGTAHPPRPPATVVRPENRSPQADPFGLTR